MSETEFAGLDPAVRIRRRTGAGMVTLRADLGDPMVADAVRVATGTSLPDMRRIEVAGGRATAWMSPDELMLFVPAAEAAAVAAGLGAALAGRHHLALDLSDARAIFRLDGAAAREVLAKGAPVDLAPAAFGPGDFRRSRLGTLAVAIWSPEPEAFELMCFQSVADYVGEWLATAAVPGSFSGVLRP